MAILGGSYEIRGWLDEMVEIVSIADGDSWGVILVVKRLLDMIDEFQSRMAILGGSYITITTIILTAVLFQSRMAILGGSYLAWVFRVPVTFRFQSRMAILGGSYRDVFAWIPEIGNVSIADGDSWGVILFCHFTLSY